MPRVTPSELVAIREKARASRRLGEDRARARITVHMGTCGTASGARKILNRLTQLIEDEALEDVVLVVSGCAGLCSREPMVTVEAAGNPPAKYADLTEAKITKVFEQHVMGGKIARRYLLAIGSEMTR